MATKTDIIQLLRLVNANYPNSKYEANEMLVSSWYAVLGHYDLPTLQAALYKTLETCKFPPTAADIREATAGLLEQSLPSLGEAWEQAQMAAEGKGGGKGYYGLKYSSDGRELYYRVFPSSEERDEWVKGAEIKGTGETELPVKPTGIVGRAIEIMGGVEAIERGLVLSPEVIRGQFNRVYSELRERTINDKLTSPVIREAGLRLAGEVQEASSIAPQIESLANKMRIKGDE